MGYAPDFGSLDELRRRGVSYVVVVASMYGRYFADPYIIPTEEFKPEFDRRKAWYERLFDERQAEGQLVWHATPEMPMGEGSFVNPEIRVYQINPKPATTAPAAAPPGRMRPPRR